MMMQAFWPDQEPEEVADAAEDPIACDFCLERLFLVSQDDVDEIYVCECGRTWL